MKTGLILAAAPAVLAVPIHSDDYDVDFFNDFDVDFDVDHDGFPHDDGFFEDLDLDDLQDRLAHVTPDELYYFLDSLDVNSIHQFYPDVDVNHVQNVIADIDVDAIVNVSHNIDFNHISNRIGVPHSDLRYVIQALYQGLVDYYGTDDLSWLFHSFNADHVRHAFEMMTHDRIGHVFPHDKVDHIASVIKRVKQAAVVDVAAEYHLDQFFHHMGRDGHDLKYIFSLLRAHFGY